MHALDVGRLVISGLEGGRLSRSMEKTLADGRIGGLILFRRDYETLAGAAALIRRARELAGRPILVGMDEEGGIVSQLDGVPVGSGSSAGATSESRLSAGAPSPWSLGERDDPTLTETVARAVGEVLRSIGVDVGFAPLLDVNTRPENPVIGSRSFGADAARVSRHGAAAARGFRSAGVLPCVKHFPGHGASVDDSHVALPVIAGSRDEILTRDVLPFAESISSGIALLMTAHASYPGLDPIFRPATRSPAILTDLLRHGLHYRGAVISDALEMTGFTPARGDPAAAVLKALHAGTDLFLTCRGSEAADDIVQALIGAAEAEPSTTRRLLEALRRRDAVEAECAAIRAAASTPDAAADTVASVAERAHGVLLDAHRRVLRVDARETPPLRPPAALLLPEGPDPARLDRSAAEATFRAAVGDGDARVYRVGKGTFAPASLARCRSVCVVLFVRGVSGGAADRDTITAVEGWRSEASGRSAIGLAVADLGILDELPPAWVRVRGTGGHRTAFEAAWTRLFGRRRPGDPGQNNV